MHRAAILAALLLCPLALAAQTLLKTESPTAITLGNLAAGNCPISMDARQGTWGNTLRVENGRPHSGIGQRITLTLGDLHSFRIVAATVKVLGLTAKNRTLNANLASDTPRDASRVVRLSSFSEATNGVAAEIYVPGFTAVTSIQLLSVTYADGSKWTAPQAKACRVSPNPLMLVAAQ